MSGYATFRSRVHPVAELGCRTGYLSKILRNYDSLIYTDHCMDMIRCARSALDGGVSMGIVSEIDRLPLAAESVDLAVSNIMPSFCSLERFFTECLRILKPEGVLMFSILGSRSFWQLKEAAEHVDELNFLAEFEELHNVGDLLVRTGYRNPIVDIETSEHVFTEFSQLINALICSGLDTELFDKAQRLKSEYVQSTLNDSYPRSEVASCETAVAVEVIYGICWKLPLSDSGMDVKVRFGQ